MIPANLITQTVSDQPVVLLIGPSSLLQRKLYEFYKKNGLAVVMADLTDSKTYQDVDIYKAIFVFSYDENPSTNLFVQWNFLNDKQTQILYLESSVEIVAQKVPHFAEASQGEEEKIESKKNIFETSVDIFQNIFKNTAKAFCFNLSEEIELFLLELYGSHEFFQNGEIEYKLFVPKAGFFIHSIDRMLQKNAPFFLSPWGGEEVVFQGSEVSQAKIENFINDNLSGKGLSKVSIEENDGIENKIVSGFEVVADDVKPELDSLVSFLSKIKPGVHSYQKTYHQTQVNIPRPQKQDFVVHQKDNNKHLAQEEDTAKIEKISLEDKKEVENKQPKVEKELSSRVDKIFGKTNQTQEKERKISLVKEVQKISKKNKKRSALFMVGMAFVGVGFGIVSLVGVFFTSNYLLKKELLGIIQEYDRDSSEINYAKLAKLEEFSSLQIEAYQALVGESPFVHYAALVETSQLLAKITQSHQRLEGLSASAVQGFMGSESSDVTVVLPEIQKEAQQTYKDLSNLELLLESFPDSYIDEIEKNSVVQKIKTEKKKVITTQQLVPLFETLVNQKEKKTYLVLLQDNQELRPTGGFFQSMALVTVDQGMIIDRQIFDSYQIDNLFAGKVDPPTEVEKYLGENQLYARDANWDPDFKTSSDQISWFVEKSLNKEIDGVIGLNLYVIQDVLKALGPVDVPEYNEILTDKNILERAEFHSEINLVNEKDKVNYLSTVLERTLDSVFLTSKEKIPSLLGSFYQNLLSNQAVISMDDVGLMGTIESLGWSGGVVTPECPSELVGDYCLVDSVYQVEANVGVNKANYSLDRSIEHNISLQSGGVVHTRKITFNNKAKTNAWPQGQYRSYIRFYLPMDAVFDGFIIDGEKVDKGRVEEYQHLGKKTVGILVEVPIKSEVTLELTYHLSYEQTSDDADFSYVFFDQKQPGTGKDPYVINISYPPEKNPKLIAPQADVKNGVVSFSGFRDSHSFVGIML